MSTRRFMFLGLFFAVMAAMPFHTARPTVEQDVIFQVSTISALLDGVYDGPVTFGQLQQHGDCGIGTFNALDGEMIGVDGKYYQIKSDGKAYPVPAVMKTPFSVVTFFEPDKSVSLKQGMNVTQLQEFLDKQLPTKNIFYVIIIKGTFSYVKTRSVPRQAEPYPPLVEVTKNQPTFEFNNVNGTIVGFRCPPFVKGINVVGYHFHFLTEKETAGGHVLDLTIQNAIAQVDYTSQFTMVLPQQESFYKLNLSDDKQHDLERVERGR